MHDDSEHRAGEESERDDGEPFQRVTDHGATPVQPYAPFLR